MTQGNPPPSNDSARRCPQRILIRRALRRVAALMRCAKDMAAISPPSGHSGMARWSLTGLPPSPHVIPEWERPIMTANPLFPLQTIASPPASFLATVRAAPGQSYIVANWSPS
ncbi:hypothetical protein VWZ88_06165 [Phaeobacter sp. JH20_36]|uniref:hypothetical protein n=1 Tax=Phaeobacter sp. JH20_29 TaxID=3112486 RepID=UPI003A8A1EC0